MMVFPDVNNSGKAKIADGQSTFSYWDSYGVAHTETKLLLSAKEIVERVKARMMRFEKREDFVRESDSSRAERKYIAAQPEVILRDAWKLADDMVKMELSMMLDKRSHHGISDPKWLMKHDKPVKKVTGDDGKIFNAPSSITAQQLDYDAAFQEAAGTSMG